jgi:hypothetical protein
MHLCMGFGVCLLKGRLAGCLAGWMVAPASLAMEPMLSLCRVHALPPATAAAPHCRPAASRRAGSGSGHSKICLPRPTAPRQQTAVPTPRPAAPAGGARPPHSAAPPVASVRESEIESSRASSKHTLVKQAFSRQIARNQDLVPHHCYLAAVGVPQAPSTLAAMHV